MTAAFQPDSNDALRADSTSKDHQSVCEDSRADIIERSSDTFPPHSAERRAVGKEDHNPTSSF